jgi:hypothetical protein
MMTARISLVFSLAEIHFRNCSCLKHISGDVKIAWCSCSLRLWKEKRWSNFTFTYAKNTYLSKCRWPTFSVYSCGRNFPLLKSTSLTPYTDIYIYNNRTA